MCGLGLVLVLPPVIFSLDSRLHGLGLGLDLVLTKVVLSTRLVTEEALLISRGSIGAAVKKAWSPFILNWDSGIVRRD